MARASSPKTGTAIPYLAFLRGINVGGHKIIKMAELAKIVSKLGFSDVRTFIQSGNVFFGSPDKDADRVRGALEKGLSQALGYDVPVMLRGVAELEKMVRKDPFDGETPGGDAKFYVAFLSEKPPAAAVRDLQTREAPLERFRVIGREVFITCEKDPAARRKYVMDSLEKILGVRATIRNWETLGKMLASS